MRNKIQYRTDLFDDNSIKSVQIHLASSLRNSKLEANTITAVVETDDDSIQYFVRNTPLKYFHKDRQRFLAYVQTIDRIGPRAYQIYGTSAIGLLMERGHAGGIYNGQTAETVVREIVGNIPFVMKGGLKGIKLYGWLPYAKPPERSARDNLVQVLFAISAALKTDLDGVLRIQPLWDGISGTMEWDRIYEDGAKAKRDGAVSSISVTEHNYITGGESTKLFEGTAIAGDIITFSEPMYNLSASGFSISASGANWARLTAGTGTLTGQKYIHNTRQIIRTVTAGAPENVVTIDDATLVSFFNSNSVADSMAEYYKHTEVIDCAVVLDEQSPGDVLNVYHPYTKEAAPACVESLDISASGTLKASMKALVGYKPPQTVDVEYFDKRQMFTYSTTFTVPAGVHNIRAVLIGGGNGGHGGYPGGAGGKGATAELHGVSGRESGAGGDGGSGGSGGSGGAGGRVAIVDIPVEPGNSVSISIGGGGYGGSSGSSGGSGGNTVVSVNGRSYSSASGSANGYTDPQTGQVFAQPGSSGTSGANGGSGGTGYGGSASSGGSVGSNHGGSGIWASSYINDIVYGSFSTTFVEFYIAGCGGGGAAIGSNGGNAVGDTHVRGVAGTGANASGYGSASSTIGGGGGGGNGGGGGGGGGGGVLIATVTGGSGTYVDVRQAGADGASGGSGSSGGSGRSGGVIFFYSEAKQAPAGSPLDKNKKLFLDKFRRILVV